MPDATGRQDCGTDRNVTTHGGTDANTVPSAVAVAAVNTIGRSPWIGGPQTKLPRPIESILAWSVAFSCLTVSGYHFLVQNYIRPAYVRWIRRIGGGCRAQSKAWLRGGSPNNNKNNHTVGSAVTVLPVWLPLVSCSRNELDRATPEERFAQLVHLLRRVTSRSTQQQQQHLPLNNISDDELTRLLRGDDVLRRLASLAMRTSLSSLDRVVIASDLCNDDEQHERLSHQLARIWPRLLALPPRQPLSSHRFSISLIMPCYGERAMDVCCNLETALGHSAHPKRIQVVLVLAGLQNPIDPHEISTALRQPKAAAATNDDDDSPTKHWGDVKIVEFAQESGRGPSLNSGAQQSDGAILAFCHSDTVLPERWDTSLVETLYNNENDNDDIDMQRSSTRRIRRCVNSCAFQFGVDTSVSNPPGIRSVVLTANLRCRLWSLPYGDQCLCLSASHFHYIGGFPYQCFMEDYELIALLRKRAVLLPAFQQQKHSVEETSEPVEELAIVPGPPVLCSPRRWSSLGVIYVTWTNSKLVNLYAGGISPDDIYRLYYNRPLDKAAPKSPWEIELEQRLQESHYI